MNLAEAIAVVEAAIADRRKGLPDEVFRFVSSVTPMINADLLIRNDLGQTLLTWRADKFYGPGWHIPGGIIRFKENIADRIQAVARSELDVEVTATEKPIAMHELMNCTRDVRGHFISLLYRCELRTPLAPAMQAVEEAPKNGMWRWHDGCPDNLIPNQAVYRAYIGPRSLGCPT